MADSWQNKTRNAEKALQSGQLELASRIVRRYELTRDRQGAAVARKIAKAYLARVGKAQHDEELSKAWLDLQEARLMDVDSTRIAREGMRLVDRTLQLIRKALGQSDLELAKQHLRLFERFRVDDARADLLQESLAHVTRAEALANEGRFAEASRSLDSAMKTTPEIKSLGSKRLEFEEHRTAIKRTTEELRKAMMGERWQETIRISDKLLALAPNYQIAKDARHIARGAIDSKMKPSGSFSGNVEGKGDALGQHETGRRETGHRTDWSGSGSLVTENSNKANSDDAHSSGASPSVLTRFLTWIDGVGGYLVCLNEQVMIGQAMPDGGVDIPIQGDISRRHLRIIRSGDQYLIEPLAETRVDGELIDDKAILQHNSMIEIGRGVKLRFTHPHALSGSAKLEFASRHRTYPWSDAVILMSDSMVFGPRSQNHVVCHRWNEDLVIYRRKGRLLCRGPSKLEIDGEMVHGESALSPNSRVVGNDFSLSLERITHHST